MNIRGPFCKVSWKDMDLNSPSQVKDYLLTLGWVPTQWNTVRDEGGGIRRTSPKLTEDSYKSISSGIGKDIALYNTLKHRRNTLENINDPYNKGLLSKIRKDGRVPAEAVTCATPTSRYAHKGAICNVPGIYAVYGEEMRAVYIVPDGCWMIGCDLSQIEMRIAAHYAYMFDNGVLAEQVLHGDFHKDVADNVYNCGRNEGKRVTYKILYGGKNVAAELGCSSAKGKKIVDRFWEFNEGLNKVKIALEKAYKKKGYINGLDGRKVRIRQEYRLLNSAIQSAAAVVFKHWLRRVHMYVPDVDQLIAYHDEGEWEFKGSKEHAINRGERIQEEITNTGNDLKLRVPITGDWKVGKSWLDVH